MTQKGLPGVGKRKDGKDRVKLTLLVTPESILGAREVSPSVSAAFEAVFEPEKDDLGVPGAEPPVGLLRAPLRSGPSDQALRIPNAKTDTP